MHKGINLIILFLSKARAVAPIRICTTEEMAFDMLVDPKTKIVDISNDQQLQGYDVDMRHEILTVALNLTYTLRVLPSYGEMQVEVRKDKCDIGWAPYFVKASRERCIPNNVHCRSMETLDAELQSSSSSTIDWTPWRCCIDYMPAHINYGMAIVFNARSISFYEALFGAFSQAFFVNFACFTFLLVILFAHLVYFSERAYNPQFPKKYLDGIDDAMWWSIVSVTTVGYGDIVPITPIGRIIAVVWMLIGIVMFSILAGIMSSNFSNIRNSVVSYKSVADLAAANVRVCSYNSEFHSGGLLSPIPKANQVSGSTMVACGELMKQGLADVTVMDAPIAKYWRSVTPWAAVLSVSESINNYAIAVLFPEDGGAAGSYYFELLKPSIIEFTDSTIAKNLASKWFPPSGSSSGMGDDTIKWDLVGPTIALVLCYMLIMAWKVMFKKSFETVSNVHSGMVTTLTRQATNVVSSVGDMSPVRRRPHLFSKSGHKSRITHEVSSSNSSADGGANPPVDAEDLEAVRK